MSKIGSAVTSQIRTFPYSIVKDSLAEHIADEIDSAVAQGKISIAYRGGGNWVVVCIDKDNRSTTVVLRVKKSGEISKVDHRTGDEKLLGKIELGQGNVPQNHTEIDLLKHFQAIELMLADEIAAHHDQMLKSYPSAAVKIAATRH